MKRVLRGVAGPLSWVAVALVLSLHVSSAYAHKVNVFAFVEGEQLYVQGYFTDGKLAKNSQVVVYQADGQVLAEGVTNDEGEFTFGHHGEPGLRVVLNAGEGHQAEYTFAPEELAGAALEPDSGAVTSVSDTAGLAPVVRRAVAEAVKPLAREIAELKERRSFSDVIGGIGFIVGLLGVFAYYKARKSAPR